MSKTGYCIKEAVTGALITKIKGEREAVGSQIC